MRRIGAPGGVGEVTVAEGKALATGGASVSAVTARYGGTELGLSLQFLPFYVPPEARPALRCRSCPRSPRSRRRSAPTPMRWAARCGDAVPIRTVALSPTYPFDSDFDRPHPPETDPRTVEWREAGFENGRIDLGAQYTGASNVVAYALVPLEADADCGLHLSMGSDRRGAGVRHGPRARRRGAVRTDRWF